MKIFCLESEAARITKLDNITVAYMEFDWLKNMINNVYDLRDTITPIETIRKRPTALQIYKLLPQKADCEKCGQMTCMAFACRLMQREDHPSKCPLLYSGEYEENKVKLIILLDVDEYVE
jgi:ArsR family metal-binding transcriptional regulator